MMTIKVKCSCGKILGSHDADAGLTGICPYCGAKIHVPGDPPIQESGLTPEVHSGPISTKSVKKVESFMFRQQRRLWLLAFLMIPAMIYFSYWRSEQKKKPRPAGPPLPAVELPNVTERAAEMERKRLEIIAPPEPIEAPKIRILEANIQYDLSKFPDGDIWTYNFNAFGPRVGAMHHSKKDLDPTFLDVEVRWHVKFDHLIGRNLFFEEAKPLLNANPAVDVWATLHPSEMSRATDLRPGEQITIRGRLGSALIARTDTHPRGIIRIGPRHCIIEPK